MSAAPARCSSRGPAGEGSAWTALNACLVPAAALDGQEVVTAEGLGDPERPAPGAARARRARRVAVRLLHAGLRVQHGRRVLPARPPRQRPRRPRARPQRLRPARAQRQPVPLHRLPADPRRRLGAGRPGRRRPARRRAAPSRRPRPRSPPALADGVGEFVRPADLAEALALLAEHPDATVLAGATDLGVEVNLRGARPAYVVAVDRLPELREVSAGDPVEIGAALTLSEVERALDGAVPLLDRGVAAVRVAADPQRRHDRRQPRHRLADRRPAAGAARAGRDAGAQLARRRPRGAARRLLHRLPRDAAAARRADPVGPGAAAARAA